MKILVAIFFLHISFFVHANIYHCVDNFGQISFRDEACTKDEELVKEIELTKPEDRTTKPDQRVQEKVIENTILTDDNPGKIIYSNLSPIVKPYNIKVHEVRIITELDDNMLFEIIYTYNHPVPANEIKIVLIPNHKYWSVGSVEARPGKNVARFSVGLSSGNMKKDRVTRSYTRSIKISFEHYSPTKYKGVIWSELVKYRKYWKLKSS
jgi:hypothetical protein